MLYEHEMSHEWQNVNNQNVAVDQLKSHQHLHYVPTTMVGGSISQLRYNYKKPVPNNTVAGFKIIHTGTAPVISLP